jgi:NAD(P)-dependent dehydrogenase (short-subunit alcohol dehydrogenase family)
MMKLNPEDIRRLTALLESVHEDRRLLAELSEEDKIALVSAAGRVALPERQSQYRLKKAQRNRRAKVRRAKDKALRDETGIRVARAAPVFSAPLLPEMPVREERLLEKPADCYVCKNEYRRIHHFYDSMCWDCGELNYRKRFQATPGLLEGKVALITGARVKIGYQASLMLLRSGASVIATTRFPHDATLRYQREPDFEQWRDRLQIHGLDLRHAPSVELFALHIARTHSRLDILINNAAQTVRRPPGWYHHLIEGEHAALTEMQQKLLAGHHALVSEFKHREALTSWRSHDPALGIHSSAELSLLPYHMEQEEQGAFPEGKLDADLQQVDMRPVNSWRLTLGEVATAEMLEVHLVNAVAPFILCGKLRPLMLRDRSTPGHIVNVSAMEGSFSRGTKTDKHPHTNMAKAALNMMTLTSARDYLKSNIYMNAVDTGWVTDEDPHHHSERKKAERDFSPPLDIVDGAARVVDPVLDAERTGNYVSGLFLKDYFPTKW